ncbi:energy-coupling factor transporter transmembrane component T family protein [Trueperella pyogenes]|uniref:energy-coupling factor transporter transmembrane component T family protein n=1 Tax=Trueperella pyogenes TaxID=1661 RepID=UPI0021684A26|nr:energy-coupling factor transporter transmembrane component T [Trueperella pyogenes]UVJ55608.1 energy-coupling factor transporter transmembrane protein EcfT [Trueperella pyogenes]WHU58336.1 energy-coupling factor transporter transmembrane component T [Trueperella pyogenes]
MGRPYGCIDPRTALLSTCLLGIADILANRPEAAHAAFVIGALYAFTVGAWRPGIALSAAYVLIAVGMSFTERLGSTTLVVAVVMLSYMAQKFVVLTLLGISLSKLASMRDLLSALQSMRAPQAVLIPCMVILRFFPTIWKDTSNLIESLKTRRILVGRGYILRHPALTCELIAIPLLMRCLRVSDELAASALARGLGAEPRPTILQPLSFGPRDAVAAVLTLLTTGALMWLQFGAQ